MDELKEIEDSLVAAIVEAYRRTGATPRQGILGVVRRDGRFVLKTPGGPADAVGVLSVDKETDESLNLVDDITRVVAGDEALTTGIMRGWDGLVSTIPISLQSEDDRRYFILGFRIGQRARKELLNA